ncbi:uncharacterized protein ACWYII_005170 [Salvelinus alpinus]
MRGYNGAVPGCHQPRGERGVASVGRAAAAGLCIIRPLCHPVPDQVYIMEPERDRQQHTARGSVVHSAASGEEVSRAPTQQQDPSGPLKTRTLPPCCGFPLDMNTGYLYEFQPARTTEDFHTAAVLVNNPRLELRLLEKLSIILQKLPKIRKNRWLFELCSLHLQERHRTAGPTCTFLLLNLSSILLNRK